jgi:hypothetical protein
MPLGLERGAWLGSKMGCGGQPTQYNGLCTTPMVAQHMLSIDSPSAEGDDHPLNLSTPSVEFGDNMSRSVIIVATFWLALAKVGHLPL